MATPSQIAPREEPQTQEIKSRRTIPPRVDIFENTDEYLITADLPGVNQDNLHIHLDRDELSIEGLRAVAENGTPIAQEILPGDFRRQFRIPELVDASKIVAELRQGVLTLHLPKVPEAKPRRIAIQQT